MNEYLESEFTNQVSLRRISLFNKKNDNKKNSLNVWVILY